MIKATLEELQKILNAPVCKECGKMQTQLDDNGKCAECNQ